MSRLFTHTIFTAILCWVAPLSVFSNRTDSVSRHGVSFSVMPSRVVALDKYERKWLTKGNNISFAIEFSRSALPGDSSAFASDYNYPIFVFGLRYMCNRAVRMHRSTDPDWGMAEEVNYDSRLGNIVSLYTSFYRPLYRSRHWETAYSISAGAGFTNKKYDKDNNIDNEQIGSNVLIYFGAGIHQTYRLRRNWGLRASLEFVHHSNGALYRPNKGSNTLGPSLALVYYPYYETLADRRSIKIQKPFRKQFYLNFSLGVGAKTMLEDWLLTQFGTPSSSPDYRTEKFKLYAAYSAQTDIMYRYARRWASGVGLDWFYGTYASHIKELDEAKEQRMKHSPWSLGIGAKHQVFYGQLSMAMSFGWYLHRRMGHNAQYNETPCYERIGIHYGFPSLHGMSIGLNVKAHGTKADLTELVVACPVNLGRR